MKCGEEMHFFANTKKDKFKFGGEAWTDPSLVACYYRVANELDQYAKDAKIYIKFTKIEPSVEIHINGGSDYYNSSTVIIENN